MITCIERSGTKNIDVVIFHGYKESPAVSHHRFKQFGYNAKYIGYDSHSPTLATDIHQAKQYMKPNDIIIGYSLGGTLASHLVNDTHKAFIMIAAPHKIECDQSNLGRCLQMPDVLPDIPILHIAGDQDQICGHQINEMKSRYPNIKFSEYCGGHDCACLNEVNDFVKSLFPTSMNVDCGEQNFRL